MGDVDSYLEADTHFRLDPTRIRSHLCLHTYQPMTTGKSLGAFTSLCLGLGAGVLIFSGGMDLNVTSEGNRNGDYFDETSFVAIGIRSQGGLKLGLGLALLGITGAIANPFIHIDELQSRNQAALRNNAAMNKEIRNWDSKNKS